MIPKVAGSWNLHQMSLRRPMDFFVFFSAGAALLGSAGQANYAAANSVTDAIVGLRRASGLPALAIQWGGWTEVGMVARLDERGRERWRAKGLEFITPREGSRWLGQLLGWNGTVAVIPARWPAYSASVPEQGRRWLGELLDKQTSGHYQANVRKLQDTLEDAPAHRRREMLMEGLMGLARAVLGVGAGFRVPEDLPLRDLGLDSLMAVELRNLLAKAGRAPLPMTLLFDYPTLAALSAYLSKAWGFGDARATENLKEFTPDASAEIEALSDNEIEDLLRSELSLARGPQ